MSYELQDIKELRKKFNLTQGQLANRANVSQSLIAKIEAGRIDPTYSKTRKIFSVLDTLGDKKEIKVEEIMNRHIIPLSLKDNIRYAIKRMRKYGISQMPVMENNHAVGLITEKAILTKMADIEDTAKLNELSVKDVMEECPPIVNKNTNMKVVSSLLLHYSAVLVSDEGKLVGIATKADILSRVYKG